MQSLKENGSLGINDKHNEKYFGSMNVNINFTLRVDFDLCPDSPLALSLGLNRSDCIFSFSDSGTFAFDACKRSE